MTGPTSGLVRVVTFHIPLQTHIISIWLFRKGKGFFVTPLDVWGGVEGFLVTPFDVFGGRRWALKTWGMEVQVC